MDRANIPVSDWPWGVVVSGRVVIRGLAESVARDRANEMSVAGVKHYPVRLSPWGDVDA